MAEKRKRKYSRAAGPSTSKVKMRRYKRGTAKSGRGGKGGKDKSRKQAIAIGLRRPWKKGRMPRKKSYTGSKVRLNKPVFLLIGT